jgi:RNA polymerase sigma-70 factor (ECF subfamily)
MWWSARLKCQDDRKLIFAFVLRPALSRIYIPDIAQSEEVPLGDPRRLARLTKVLDEQGTRLYGTLQRLTQRGDVARELLQELFVRLGQSDGFAAATDPNAYASRMAINIAMEWRRKRQKPALHPNLRDYAREPTPLNQLVRNEQIARVLDALHRVAELPRTCFVLRFVEQKSYEEIARQTGKTPHQARGLCHAAVRRVRAQVFDESDEPSRQEPPCPNVNKTSRS